MQSNDKRISTAQIRVIGKSRLTQKMQKNKRKSTLVESLSALGAGVWRCVSVHPHM